MVEKASKIVLFAVDRVAVDEPTWALHRVHHLAQDNPSLSQFWGLAVNGAIFGDALVLTGGWSVAHTRIAVVRIDDRVEVVLCEGIVNALARLGYENVKVL